MEPVGIDQGPGRTVAQRLTAEMGVSQNAGGPQVSFAKELGEPHSKFRHNLTDAVWEETLKETDDL